MWDLRVVIRVDRSTSVPLRASEATRRRNPSHRSKAELPASTAHTAEKVHFVHERLDHRLQRGGTAFGAACQGPADRAGFELVHVLALSCALPMETASEGPGRERSALLGLPALEEVTPVVGLDLDLVALR